MARLAELVARQAALPEIASGFEAALSLVKLMDRSANRIPPRRLVQAYLDAGGTPHVKERDALWRQFGEDTAAVMADGARVLAMLWKSAWLAGGGGAIATADIKAIAPAKLRELYEDPEFVPSLTLDQIEPVLQ